MKNLFIILFEQSIQMNSKSIVDLKIDGGNSKTVYVQQQGSKKSQRYFITISDGNKNVDLSCILCQIPDWQQNPIQDAYIGLDTICEIKFMLPRSYLQLQYILIKYYQESEKSEQEIQSQENKKQRSKERSLRQVIELVHKWRQLHETPSQRKKINLQQSAKIVGISKKSLDDYFFQLRIGEKYGFDFTANMESKVGTLRSFVKKKQCQYKKQPKQKVLRYPKKLKILQQYAQKIHLQELDQVKIETKQQQRQTQKGKMVLKADSLNLNIVDSSQFFWGSPFDPIEQKAIVDCQNNFFKDFQNLMEQPNDPFIPFANFKKTKSIFGDEPNQNSSSNIGF